MRRSVDRTEYRLSYVAVGFFLCLEMLTIPLTSALWVTVSDKPGITLYASKDDVAADVCAVGLNTTVPVTNLARNFIGNSFPTLINYTQAQCYSNTNEPYLNFSDYLTTVYQAPVIVSPLGNENSPVLINFTSDPTYPYQYKSAAFNILFKNNMNKQGTYPDTIGAVRFERDGYFFAYSISDGQMLWRGLPGQPTAMDTLGGTHSSNTLDTKINVSGDLAVYADAYSDLVNASYLVSSKGVKETYALGSLSIKTKDGIPYDYLELQGNIYFNKSLQICANGNCSTDTLPKFNTSGKIYFNEGGIPKFFLKEPIITDSKGSTVKGIYRVYPSNAQVRFDLEIPTSFLQNALQTGAFPVYIDPTIYITSASHLDENRTFISDVYDAVSTQDDVWSEHIPVGDYVRVTFEQNLTAINAIDIYTRNNTYSNDIETCNEIEECVEFDENDTCIAYENVTDCYYTQNPNATWVEIYAMGSSELLATSPIITHNGTYSVSLAPMGNASYDTFDLRIVGPESGYLDFDYIVDTLGTGGTITYDTNYVYHTFTADGTFVPPTGVTAVQVQCWGSGGGGGGTTGSTYGGGGGGGGAYSIDNVVAVTPGTGYAIVAGTPGYGVSGAEGIDGEQSSFATTTVVASAGKHGGLGSTANGHAGAAGTTGTGDTVTAGTVGNAGGVPNAGYGGAGGAAGQPGGGAGSPYRNWFQAGGTGGAPGGGASGAGKSGAIGGTGGVGEVIVRYTSFIPTITSIGGDGTAPFKTSDDTPTVLATTAQNAANCRASVDGDESYDDMADDVDCSGDGTSSYTCQFTSTLPEGSNIIYVACSYASGNKNGVDDNTQATVTIDVVTPPVPTITSIGGDSSVPYVTTDNTPTVLATTDENADCRASIDGDESYDGMSDDVDCTGDGTTSHTCQFGTVGDGSAVNFYVACKDTEGNKDSSAQNVMASALIDSTPPVATFTSIGGDSSAPYVTRNSTPTVLATTNENADCYATTVSDRTYDQMVSAGDVDCTGDGGTSQTCHFSTLTDGVKTFYIACRDTLLNKNDASNNAQVNATINLAPPVITFVSIGGDTTMPYVTKDTTPTILTTTNVTADCKAIMDSNRSYDRMGTDATGGTITYEGAYTIHTFITDGTFTPHNSGNVQVEVWGGGGGGGGGPSSPNPSGGGGGGGAYAIDNVVAVTGSTGYAIVAGTGGTAASGAEGGDGEASSFGGTTVVANGGGHGGVGATGPTAGHAGAAGTGGTGDTIHNGGAGSIGGTSSAGGGGGGGSGGTSSVGNAGNAPTGSPPSTGGLGATAVTGGGNGGNGGNHAASGVAPTTSPGGGGGGGGASGPTSGGVGANGMVKIKYLTNTQGAAFVDCTGDGTTSQTCQFDTALSIGSHMLYVACQDAYGNKNSAANNAWANVTFDTTPPILTWDWTRNTTSGYPHTLNITVKTNEAVSLCRLEINGSNNTMTLKNTTYAYYSYSTVGNHTFKAYCNDTANNWGYTYTVWYNINGGTPTFTINSAKNTTITTTVHIFNVTTNYVTNCTLHLDGSTYANSTKLLTHTWVKTLTRTNHTNIYYTCTNATTGTSGAYWLNIPVCPLGMSGSNTTASPCLITTCVQLQNMSAMLKNNYALANDIDCSTTTGWDSGNGFLPVGTLSTKFKGTFNGSYYNISNLYIHRTGTDNIGLFGYTYGATITNVGIKNANITGHDSVGGIVGNLDTSSVLSNSFSMGVVSGNDNVGGLVGYLYNTINSSYSTSKVSGAFIVGGLVGFIGSSSRVIDSYSIGNVSASSNGAGGLVGYLGYSTLVNNSYATGTLSGTSGGLVGIKEYPSSTITDSYWYDHSGDSAIDCYRTGGGVGGNTGCTRKNATNGGLLWFYTVANAPMSVWAYPPWDDYCDARGYPPLAWQGLSSLSQCSGYTTVSPVITINSDKNATVSTPHTFDVAVSKNSNCSLYLGSTWYANSTVGTHVTWVKALSIGNNTEIYFKCHALDGSPDGASGTYWLAVGGGNTAPVVDGVLVGHGLGKAQGYYDPTIGTSTVVSAQINISDAQGWADVNLSNPGTKCVLNKSGVSINLSSCTKLSNSSATKALYNCTGDMQYYHLSGVWTVNCTAYDGSSLHGSNATQTLTYNRLEAISVQDSLEWSNAYPTSTNVRADDSINISNEGNAYFKYVNITGHNLVGMTDNNYYLLAEDFSCNKYDASEGTPLVNNDPVTIPDVSLLIGAGSKTPVYSYLEQITRPGPAQYYSTLDPWSVMVYGAENTNP